MQTGNLQLQVGVKALLKNSCGNYLLLMRNPKKYPGIAPSWDMPGGRIDPGSLLLENLKREIREETGLHFGGSATLIAAQDIMRPEKHVVRLTFIGSIEGEPVIGPEHTKVKWFSPKEILQMENLDPYLKDLIEKKFLYHDPSYFWAPRSPIFG